MGSYPAVVDISSDEEGNWDEPIESPTVDSPINWLSELLGHVDNEAEESDDVVVVDELSCASIQKQNVISSNAVKGSSADGSDDECLVLDGDPDNPVAVVDDARSGSDDILIVGEKGQVACRDYPHPRHLCIKFPFSSTPHEKHCDLCHCYVCDIRAPCIYWGTGFSGNDHCHSTDKEEMWKLRRKCFKQGNTAAAPPDKLPDTTLSIMPPWHNPEPTLPLPQPRNLGTITVQSSISKSTPLRACSTSFDTPNIISHRHTQQSRPMHGKHRLAPYPSRSQPLIPGTHAVGRVRGAGNAFGPQFTHPHLKYKRGESTRGNFSTVNRSTPSNSSRWYTQPRIQTAPAMAKRGWQDFLAGIDLELGAFEDSSQLNSNSSFGDLHSHGVSLQPQGHGLSNMDPSMYQIGNPPLADETDPNPLDFNYYDWTPQPPSATVATSPNVQLPEPPAVMQPEPWHPESTSGSSEFHLDSWMYSMEHPLGPEATMDPLILSPPQATGADPAMLLYEYEEYMGHIGRVS